MQRRIAAIIIPFSVLVLGKILIYEIFHKNHPEYQRLIHNTIGGIIGEFLVTSIVFIIWLGVPLLIYSSLIERVAVNKKFTLIISLSLGIIAGFISRHLHTYNPRDGYNYESIEGYIHVLVMTIGIGIIGPIMIKLMNSMRSRNNAKSGSTN